MTALEKVMQRAELDARAHGYRLNPDSEFLQALIEGLRVNEERYGYPSCPCRIATGIFEADRDIICPCDYRDPDVEEFGACYCCLYVDEATHESGEIRSIPERRPQEKQIRSLEATGFAEGETTQRAVSVEPSSAIDRKLFYCKQCGYVVFREEPPYVCPICRAKREMFEEIETR
jgi:ferredoxin-thioredoxin reductase catalytic chain